MEFDKLHGKEMGGNQIITGQTAPTPAIRHVDLFQIFVASDFACRDNTASTYRMAIYCPEELFDFL